MSKTVAEYQNDIMNAQNEIAKIQATCEHKEYSTCMYSWRIGSSYPTRICKVCAKPIEGITSEEAERAWKDSFLPTFSQSSVSFSGTIEKPENE